VKSRVRLFFLSLLLLVLTSGSILASGTFNFTANVQKVVLDNGVTLLLKENPAYDIIAISLMTGVGTVHDPEGLEGLTYLTQRNLLSGTANRTAQELIVELESLGVQGQTAASYDYSAILFQCMPTTFEECFDILLDILNNSTFPEPEFERERSLSFATLQSLTDDPVNALALAYLELFYGDHPYKVSPYGSADVLAAIQREDLAIWKEHMYQPEHIVVAVVGNFASAELLPILEEGFGSWKNDYDGTLIPRDDVEFVYPSEDREVVINIPTEAAFLILGYPAPDSFDEDSAAMSVINSVLGDGMSSRLFTEIREKRGLAYAAMSQYDERLGPSSLFTFLATHPQNVELAKEQVLSELQRFVTEGLTEEEITQVAAQKRGSYLLEQETNMSQAMMLAMTELTGRGYEWIDDYMTFFDDVTTDDIKRVAEKYFQNHTSILITP
jgi:zinc protease